jgi:hypothetical protein
MANSFALFGEEEETNFQFAGVHNFLVLLWHDYCKRGIGFGFKNHENST